MVPHPDDEINVAGSIIYDAVQRGDEVYVCFSTNGDFKYKAETRQKEAVEALRILGVFKENIIFLGYPDTDRSYRSSVYTTTEGTFVSRYGQYETYCNDFATRHRGKPSLYTKVDFLNDVEAVIGEITPNVLISVGYDNHPDHRALALAVDTAVGRIVKKRPDYEFCYYVGFAYSPYFFGPRDYMILNLKSTKYECMQDLIGYSCFLWEKRIRIPNICMTCNIQDNILYRALQAHTSQCADYHADRIINSDWVYWERLVKNPALHAKVEVSSNESAAHYLNDFKLYEGINLWEHEVRFENYLWKPDNTDINPYICFMWEHSIAMAGMRLYGPVNDITYEAYLRVSVDDKIVAEGEYTFYKGHPVSVMWNSSIRGKTLQVWMDTKASTFGIAECEVLQTEVVSKCLLTEAQVCICVGEDFVNEVYYTQQESVPLNIYVVPGTNDVYSLEIQGNKAVLIENVLTMCGDQHVRVEAKNLIDGKVRHAIQVVRVSKIYWFSYKMMDTWGVFIRNIRRRLDRIRNKILYKRGKL